MLDADSLEGEMVNWTNYTVDQLMAEQVSGQGEGRGRAGIGEGEGEEVN